MRRGASSRSAIFVALAFVPKLAIDIPYVFKRLAQHARDAAAARAVPPLRRPRAHLRPAVRLHRAAVVRARALLRGRRLRRGDRDHASGTGASGRRVAFTALVGVLLPLVLGAVSLRVGGIAFAMVTLAFAQAGSILVFKNPYKWTGGEEGFGVDYTKLPAWPRRHLQHEEPLLARARLRGRRLRRRAVGGQLVARATSGRRSARTSCASRCSGCARTRTS